MSETAEVKTILRYGINQHYNAWLGLCRKQLPARLAAKLAIYGNKIREQAEAIGEASKKCLERHIGDKTTLVAGTPEFKAYDAEIKAMFDEPSELQPCSVKQEEIFAACESNNITLSSDEAACVMAFFTE